VDEVVRSAYDTVSESYAALLEDELASKPVERALLTTFAELLGDGPVLDAGCGTGRITQLLVELGLDACGVDLSPGMIAAARRAYPELRFEVGDMAHLATETASLAGVLAWYSTIHTPPEELPAVLAEFRRVLRADGWLLLGFQSGEGATLITSAYGHDDLNLMRYCRSVEQFRALLIDAGFRMHTHVVREPEGVEKWRVAYVLARARVASPRR
jgi:SAM-dependent methyltransferase